jgi:hypothetical protein
MCYATRIAPKLVQNVPFGLLMWGKGQLCTKSCSLDEKSLVEVFTPSLAALTAVTTHTRHNSNDTRRPVEYEVVQPVDASWGFGFIEVTNSASRIEVPHAL